MSAASELKKSGRRELWLGLVIAAALLASTAFSTVQMHALADCNKRLISVIETRSSYSDRLQKLDERHNTAILTMVNVTTLSDRDAARQIFLDQIVELQKVDAETKTLVAERNAHKLPELKNCL